MIALNNTTGGSEDGGAVHELQRARRRQGHHAVDSPVSAQERHARSRRGHQDGVPKKENIARIWLAYTPSLLKSTVCD